MIGRNEVCLLALVSCVAPSLAWAEATLVNWVQQQVESQLVKPLAEQRASFSRRRPPPRESRVRVLQTTPSVDQQERTFVPFAVDVRSGSDWSEDMTGCIYRADSKIFVKRGDSYRPAAYMLGENADAVQGVCEAAAPKSRS